MDRFYLFKLIGHPALPAQVCLFKIVGRVQVRRQSGEEPVRRFIPVLPALRPPREVRRSCQTDRRTWYTPSFFFPSPSFSKYLFLSFSTTRYSVGPRQDKRIEYSVGWSHAPVVKLRSHFRLIVRQWVVRIHPLGTNSSSYYFISSRFRTENEKNWRMKIHPHCVCVCVCVCVADTINQPRCDEAIERKSIYGDVMERLYERAVSRRVECLEDKPTASWIQMDIRYGGTASSLN